MPPHDTCPQEVGAAGLPDPISRLLQADRSSHPAGPRQEAACPEGWEPGLAQVTLPVSTGPASGLALGTVTSLRK